MTLERRPRQLIAVWSDDGKSVKGAHLEKSLFFDGTFIKNEVTSITDITPEGFKSYADLFNSDLIKQHEEVVVERDKLNTDLSTTTAEKETLQKQVDQLEAQLVQTKEEFDKRIAGEVSILTNSIDKLKSELETSRQKEAELGTRLSKLLVELPFDPRLIRTGAFLDRIQDLIFTLSKLSDTDTVAQGFLKSLYEKEEANDSIKLDSPKLSSALSYLIEQGQLKPERAKDIVRDCTRAEAYVS